MAQSLTTGQIITERIDTSVSEVDQQGSVDARDLRVALGHFATGITVITASTAAGLFGVTANSFNSLSLSPPLILWSLNNSSAGLGALKQADGFCVNVLGEDQLGLSQHFARKMADKFSDVEFHTGIYGSPVLHGCIATFECRTTDVIKRGDHHIFIGEVLDFSYTQKRGLIYQMGRYARAVEYAA